VVFHRGFRPPATETETEEAPFGGATPLSTYSVIIIIATEAVAQFTIGEPVQKLDDMLPLTSSAILIRLPVGVMFWKASLNALSSAATTLGFGDHARLPLSPWPFW